MIRRPLPLWQRNIIGVIVAAAALTAYTFTELWPPWAHYRDTIRPEHVVAARQSQTIDGQTWSIGEVRHLGDIAAPGSQALPDGTVLTVVTVDRSGVTPPGQACGGVLTDGEHRWRGQTLSTYSIPMAPGAWFNCTKPGPLQWAFLHPTDTVPTAVDVTAPDGVILVRLQL
ncbi:MAG TPA: hypothetical protein VIQ11_21805 [Mycobacterium sp.]